MFAMRTYNMVKYSKTRELYKKIIISTDIFFVLRAKRLRFLYESCIIQILQFYQEVCYGYKNETHWEEFTTTSN